MTNPFASGNLYDATQGMAGYGAFDPIGFTRLTGAATGRTLDSANQQQSFLNALGMNGGLNAGQHNILAQQQGLSNQYGQMALGQGPNPAQAQLAQNTGQNISQQAAMMASARGSQSNPGLIASQAAQVGGGIQQQSVGQAATLGAQQQIAAMQAQQGQQAQMANLTTAGAGQQQTALSQLGQQNMDYQQLMQNQLNAQNQQRTQAQIANTNATAGIQQSGMNNTAGLFGGVMQGAGLLGAAAILANKGGQVPGYADGGPVAIAQQTRDNLKKQIFEPGKGGQGAQTGAAALQQGLGTGLSALGSAAMSLIGQKATGQDISIGGSSDNSSKMNTNLGGSFTGSTDLPGLGVNASAGGKINGKPKVRGDSEKNDTVPAMLSPGEVVIPRTHVHDAKQAANFLNGLMGWRLKAA